MSEERATYITYNEGVEAKNLRLGNLVHDHRNPISLNPHVERAYNDMAEPIPAWGLSIPLENYALVLGNSQVATERTSDAAKEEDGQRYQVVAAAKATKIELKDPKKFFNEVTLNSDDAKKWLSSHIAAGESLAEGKSHPRPQVWMLTGLILMTHATWTSLSSDQTFTPGLQAPFDPTGVTQIRRLSVSDGVRPTFGYTPTDAGKHVSGAVIHETGKYPGIRGWAAQWRKVDIQIVSKDKVKGGAQNQLALKNSPKIAVIEVQENAEKYTKGSVEVIDEDYWEAFQDACEELE